jgi:hypothetical protein
VANVEIHDISSINSPCGCGIGIQVKWKRGERRGRRGRRGREGERDGEREIEGEKGGSEERILRIFVANVEIHDISSINSPCGCGIGIQVKWKRGEEREREGGRERERGERKRGQGKRERWKEGARGEDEREI